MPDQETVAPAPVILKLGRQSAKRVKQLRSGHGRLMERVLDSVKEMQRTGVIAAGAPPVIVVVRQENEPLFG